MSEAITTARPYAQAAYDEAQRLSDLKGWSEMLTSLAASLSTDDMIAVISNPRIANSKVEELVLELSGNQITKEQTNFIRLLVEGRRLDVVSEILVMFEALRAEAEKFAEVTVSSAFELNDAQTQKISAALKAKMQCEIKLTCKVDSDLLGGIVIRANDKVIDGSARTRLADMAIVMA